MNSPPNFMNEFSLKDLFQIQPELLIRLIGDVLIIICIVIFSFFFLHFLSRILKKIRVPYLPSPLLDFLRSLLKWMILAGALLLILQQVGIKLNSLWGVISTVMAMVAIGFVAVWSVLSNLLCTLMLMIFQPFRIGDHVEIIDPAMTVGLGGKVKNINMIFTSLDSPGDDPGESSSIYVPNNLFFQKILRKKKGRRTYGIEKQVFEKDSLLGSITGPEKNQE